MKKIILFIALLSILPTEAFGSDLVKKHVLFLNSYQNGYAWSDTILEGARDHLQNSEHPVDLQIEYMDTKKYRGGYIRGILYDYYKRKFQGSKFDVIISSDNNAFSFLLEARDELFPDTPVVFCGVNDFHDAALKGTKGFTGLLESPDMRANLELAVKFRPETKKILVIGDDSVTSKAIVNQVRDVQIFFSDKLEFEYRENDTLSEILDMVNVLPPDTILFFTPFYKGAHGELFSAEEVLEAIHQKSDSLIFSSWLFLLGHGTVGGKLLDGYHTGKTAAQMAVRILNGEKPADIPIVKKNIDPYVFDYHILKKHNITEAMLPEGSKIINEPDPFYKLPPQVFWTIIVSLGVLTFTMILLVISIVQRKSVEHKIKDQLSFQEILMDTLPLLICWKDREQRYLGTNKAFNDFFRIDSPQTLMGHTDLDDLPFSEFFIHAEKLDREVMKTGDPKRRVDIQVKAPEGKDIWLEINKVPLYDEKGGVVGTLSTAEDVTAKVVLEKQLLQSQKMEAIGTLAGGIAHDFNNILTSIVNSTELALIDVEESSMTHKDLTRALLAAQRGSRLVKQILAFSRPSQEGFIATSITELLREALDLLKASLPRNIVIKRSIFSDMGMTWADPTQIHQVIMNLCTNSFQALRNHGGILEAGLSEVMVAEEEAHLLNLSPGPYLKLTVADNGPGIDEDITDKIFDPFFTTKGKTDGTGLGLAVVHGIIKGHKGGITVNSVPWKHTEFNVYLPRQEMLAGMDDIPEKAGTGGMESILFVEDDPDQLETTPRLLKRLGYKVAPMRYPSEAAEAMLASPKDFDLVITDYDMPEMNGLELAERIHQIDPKIPVIIVTGRSNAVKAAKMVPNIKRIVLKPYSLDMLSDAVRRVLDRKEDE